MADLILQQNNIDKPITKVLAQKTLHLTLKKKWFDLISKADKREEYRDIKESFIRKLIDSFNGHIIKYLFRTDSLKTDCIKKLHGKHESEIIWKQYDSITFSNGYKKNRKQFCIEFSGVEIGEGKLEWGAEKGKQYFKLALGEIMWSNFEIESSRKPVCFYKDKPLDSIKESFL
jgi:hypothetical protein